MTTTEIKPYNIEVLFKNEAIRKINFTGRIEESGQYFVNLYEVKTGHSWSIARDEIFIIKTYY